MHSKMSKSEEQNSWCWGPNINTPCTCWEFYFGVALIWFHELNTVRQWDCSRYALGPYLLVYFHPKVIQSECFEMILQHKPEHSRWWQLGVLLPRHTPSLNQNATVGTPNAYRMTMPKLVRHCEEGSSRWTIPQRRAKGCYGACECLAKLPAELQNYFDEQIDKNR